MRNIILVPALAEDLLVDSVRKEVEIDRLSDIDVEDGKEKINTRKAIALGLLSLMSILLLGLLGGTAIHRWEPKDTIDLSAAIVSPVIGIFGTAMGFYFGSNKQK